MIDRRWGKVVTQRQGSACPRHIPQLATTWGLHVVRAVVGGGCGQHPARSLKGRCTRLLHCLHLLSSSGPGNIVGQTLTQLPGREHLTGRRKGRGCPLQGQSFLESGISVLGWCKSNLIYTHASAHTQTHWS